MTDLNVITLSGRITRDIGERDLTYLSTGNAKLTFSIAVNRSFQRNNEWVNEASYFDVVAWGKTAENLQRKIYKGLQCVISGSLKQDRWTDNNGQNRSKIYINLDSFVSYPVNNGQTAPQQISQNVPQGVPQNVQNIQQGFNGEYVENGFNQKFPEDIPFE